MGNEMVAGMAMASMQQGADNFREKCEMSSIFKGNLCQAHSQPRNVICEKCVLLLCPTCYIKEHSCSKCYIFKSKLLETYNFKQYLGRGTFGNVFAVQHHENIKDVALKMVDSVNVDAFQKKFQVLELKHKNLINCESLEILKEENRVALLMELAESSFAQEIQNQQKIFNVGLIIKYFKDVCEGLQYLHSKKILHGNLKPKNILIQQKIAKLTDYGLLNELNPEKIPTLLPYLAPEVLNGKSYEEKSDIWSMGVIFYEILSKGKQIFKYESPEDLKLKIVDPENIINFNEILLVNELLSKIIEGFLIIY